jgi:hypothetical protein
LIHLLADVDFVVVWEKSRHPLDTVSRKEVAQQPIYREVALPMN